MGTTTRKLKKPAHALMACSLLAGLLSPAIGVNPAVANGPVPEGEPAANEVQAAAQPAASVFSDFITVDGDALMEGDQPFRFASLNYPGAMRDPAFSQEDALRTIAAMGGKVTRTYVPPVKRYDNANASYALVKGPDAEGVMQFNEEGFRKLDHLLALANQYGVRLIIPFVDQWQWEGGIESYVNFRYPGTISNDAANDPDAWKFYTDPLVISDFKQVIHYMMNRVNTVTGVKYKDDPAILAWETGNELGGYNQDKFPQSWTTEIARYIQEDINPSQLLLDGRFAVHAESLTDPNIDIVGNHFYTGSFIDKINADQASAEGKKPYILGEFGLYTTGEPVDQLYNAALQNGTDGIMIWSLRPHKDDGGFYWHDENPGNWASYHWPGFASGNYYGEKDIIRTVYKYAHYMNTGDTAKTTPVPPIPAPANAPVLFPIESVADIRWLGSVGASGYEVQRSVDGENWISVTTDFSDGGRAGTPTFHDEKAITGQAYQYRVRGVNETGVSDWSNVVPTTAKHVITDELSLLYSEKEKRRTFAYDHSSNVLTSSPDGNERGYGYKAYVSTPAAGTLTYASPVPLSEVRMAAAGSGAVKWFASEDGRQYEEIQPAEQDGQLVAEELPANTRYVKFSIPGGNSVQIDCIQLLYDYDGTGYEAVPPLVRSGFIKDTAFEDAPVARTSNLSVESIQAGEETVNALTKQASGDAELVYKADGDINSYRVTAYANTAEEIEFHASIDGVTYTKATPTVSRAALSGGWSKVVYTDFAVPAGARYVKLVYPAAADEQSPAVARFELGYGSSMIPPTDKPPANVLEDGEYDYGQNESIQARYEKDAEGGDIAVTLLALDTLVAANAKKGTSSMQLAYDLGEEDFAGLTRSTGHADLSMFDALHAVVAGDGSGNTLAIRLTTADGGTWEGRKTLSGTSEETIEIKLTDFVRVSGEAAEPNWRDVTAFGMYVARGESATSAGGAITLDNVKLANASKLDGFEGYGGYNVLLQKAFSRNAGGGAFAVSLDAEHRSEGNYGMRVDYNFAGPGYAGGSFNPDFLNLKGYDGFTFWFQPDGAGNELAIQFTDDAGKYWETKVVYKGNDARLMYVPFDAFRHPGWYSQDQTARPDANRNIVAFSLYIGGGEGSLASSGTFYVDDINGAQFMEELGESTVVIDKSVQSATALPVTIHGTATGAKYVAIHAGDLVFHTPVKPDGTWTYASDKLPNGDIAIKAAVELFDGTALSSDTHTLSVNVPNNPNTGGEPGPVLTNYVQNPGFEEAVDANASPALPKHWTNKDAEGAEVTSGIAKIEAVSPRSGTHRLAHWNDVAYEVTTSQTVSNLPDGIYELRAWTKSKGGQQIAEMTATAPGGETKKIDIPAGEGTWAYLKLSDLTVRGGELAVGFHSKDLGGNWIAVEDVELVKTGDINYAANPSFDEPVDAGVWPILPKQWVNKDASGADIANGIVKLEAANTHSGAYRLVHYNAAAYEATTSQTVTNLPDGVYTLSAYTKSKGGQEKAELQAIVGESVRSAAIPAGEGAWVTTSVTNIEVRGGELTIAIHSKDATGNTWISVDDVTLVRSGNLAVTAVAGVSLNKNASTLDVGASVQLTATITPANATNKDVTWSSSDATVASIADGLVTAKKAGTAVITVTTADGGKQASATVTVVSPTTGGGSGAVVTPPVTTDPNRVVEGGDIRLKAAGTGAEAVVTVKTDEVKKALEQDKDGVLAIKVEIGADAKTLKVSIPVGAFGNDADAKSIRIESGLGAVTVARDLFFQALAGSGATEQTLELTIKAIDPSGLPSDTQAQLSGSTVYDFALRVNGKPVHEFEGRQVQVAIPYKLQEGKNTNAVIVYYVDEAGKLTIVPGARYESVSGQAVFAAEHFSGYAAAYRAIAFDDASSAPWAADAIQFLAARDIVRGVGEGRFNPDGSVTRAEFVQMLMNAASFETKGGEGGAGAEPAFTDVAVSAWYYESVTAAKQLGLVKGRADGSFGADERITRQEMAVMLHRAAGLLDVELAQPEQTAAFLDADAIAGFAREAAQAVQAAGLMQGASGKFLPDNAATRAESAVVVYRLFQSLHP
ncbi:S-layer homology domain-containing protein [Paenibacillus methanolicus]|uniref:mannan endo-1,4-beta-mannosidase n=1 Tax=Paenibacillus methanolicus TaxID=582686 RepID=A0A5S5C9P5_9BACL|nr:S-layer homology domain-containing protein [Paenibacillus methanolicus]TYP74713.1 carbohydrate binding protein with CBM11 domain [Paenibacillus methanolicus]